GTAPINIYYYTFVSAIPVDLDSFFSIKLAIISIPGPHFFIHKTQRMIPRGNETRARSSYQQKVYGASVKPTKSRSLFNDVASIRNVFLLISKEFMRAGKRVKPA